MTGTCPDNSVRHMVDAMHGLEMVVHSRYLLGCILDRATLAGVADVEHARPRARGTILRRNWLNNNV